MVLPIQMKDMVGTEVTPRGATNEGQISGLELKECPIDSYLHNIMKCTYRDSDSC